MTGLQPHHCEGTLRRLVASDAPLGSKLHLDISRILCRRLAATSAAVSVAAAGV